MKLEHYKKAIHPLQTAMSIHPDLAQNKSSLR
jgi:hypothetical protein